MRGGEAWFLAAADIGDRSTVMLSKPISLLDDQLRLLRVVRRLNEGDLGIRLWTAMYMVSARGADVCVRGEGAKGNISSVVPLKRRHADVEQGRSESKTLLGAPRI